MKYTREEVKERLIRIIDDSVIMDPVLDDEDITYIEDAVELIDPPKRYRTFNVEYYDPESKQDETQFDIKDGSFEEMFNELIGLFGDFCDDNYGSARSMCEIDCIYEVPYDGEEE